MVRPRNDVVVGPMSGATIDELVEMLQEMKIAQVRRDEGQNFLGCHLDFPRRCIWSDSLEQQRTDCSDFQDALRCDVIYLYDNRIHSSETWRPLRTNFGWGGMKDLLRGLEERNVGNTYYSSARIRVKNEIKTQGPQIWEFWLTILA